MNKKEKNKKEKKKKEEKTNVIKPLNVYQDEFISLNRIVYIGTHVNHDNTNDIVTRLFMLDTISNAPIILFINSYGGSAQSAIAIRDAILSLRSKVITVASGVCMSAGSFIFSSGAKGYRYTYKNTTFLVHPMRQAGFTIDTLEESTVSLKSFEKLNKIYTEEYLKMIDKKHKKKFLEMLKYEPVTLYSDEYIELGLADKIITKSSEIFNLPKKYKETVVENLYINKPKKIKKKDSTEVTKTEKSN